VSRTQSNMNTQYILSTLVVCLCISTSKPDPDDSFEDLVYEYYTFTNSQLYDDIPLDRDLEQEEDSIASSAEFLERIGDITEVGTNQKKNDFGMTLTGMMNALNDIQLRGDKMLQSVRIQQERLQELESQVEIVKEEKAGLEREVKNLAQEKVKIAEEMEGLRIEKDAVILDVQQSNGQIDRMKTEIQPLVNQVNQRRLELINFDQQIKTKKSELSKLKTELASAVSGGSEKLGNVTVAVPSSANLSPFWPFLILSLLVNVFFLGPYIPSLIDQISRSDFELPPTLTEGLTKLSPTIFPPSISEKISQYTSLLRTPTSRPFNKFAKAKNSTEKFEPSQLISRSKHIASRQGSISPLSYRNTNKEVYEYYELPREF